ncbi:MAG: rRNA pseudouridine synthase [Bacteroidales bacterium]|nr:rRNA pseudouridine synthase [Bacteroidales bacterium]
MEKYNLDHNEEGRKKEPRRKRAEGNEFNKQNGDENHNRRNFKKGNNKRLKGSDEIIQNKINRRKTRQAPPEPKYDGTTRLNKYISNAGICSRRDADKLIEAGAVTVNGEVITVMGYRVKEGDVVSYAGRVLRSEPKRYFLLNKPKGYITTLDDPQERNTVMSLVQGCCRERIYPVGRLDKNTTGLLLFTNDGEMAKRLTHPSSNIYKIYQVECDRPVSNADMKRMIEGIVLEDGPIAVDDVQYQGGQDRSIVGVALHSGRNRIVRRIFEHLGYEVKKLDRTCFAGLTKKDLARGRVRELTQQEVNYLMMIGGSSVKK